MTSVPFDRLGGDSSLYLLAAREEKKHRISFFTITSMLKENILLSGIRFPTLTGALSWNARNAPEIHSVWISGSHFLMANLHSVLVELM